MGNLGTRKPLAEARQRNRKDGVRMDKLVREVREEPSSQSQLGDCIASRSHDGLLERIMGMAVNASVSQSIIP